MQENHRAVLSFDGKDDFVSFPAVDLDYSKGLTIEAMVRWTSFNSWSRILDFSNGPGTDNILLANQAGSPDLALVLLRMGQDMRSVAPGVLEPNRWTHVAAVVDAAGAMTLFKDGQLVHTAEGALPFNVVRRLNYLGRSAWSTDGYFHGLMTDIRIWGVARSQAEIEAHRLRVLSGTEPGLLAYWPANEGAGATLTDRTGRGHHGTLEGVTWHQVTDLAYESPSAAIWIGNPMDQLSEVDGASGYYFVDQQLSIGVDGRITALRLVAKQANPVELVIYRKVGTTFTMVGKSPVFDIPSAGLHELTLPSPISVKKDDLVGWHDLRTGVICCHIVTPGAAHTNDRVAYTGDVAGTAFGHSSNRVYSIQVKVEGSSARQSGASGSGGEGASLVNALDRVRLEDGGLAGMLRYNEAILADSPVGYWKLNERSGTVAHDVSGNGHHGTYRGSVGLADKGAFAEGDAVTFDGKSHVEIATGTWGGGKEITVEAWVNVHEQTSDFQAIVSAPGTDFVHLQLSSEGNIVVYTNAGDVVLPHLPQAPLNAWRHLALVAGGGVVKLYVDGELASSAQGTFDTIAPTSTLHIGSGYGGGRFFHGAIDEVAIYSYALPPERIRERVRLVREINRIAARGESPRERRAVLSFDGKSYVEVKDPFENNKDFTISLWARPSVLDDGHYHGLIGKQGDWRRKPGLWLCPSGAGLHYDSYSTQGKRFADKLGSFFEKNQWVHITWVKRGDKYEFYRNGQLFAERPAPAEFYHSNTSYWIGRVDNFWTGEVAEVRVWNVALHPSEAAVEMLRIPRGDDTRLAYYWPLNEGEGTAAYDRTGQDDGKIVGATWAREKTPFTLSETGGEAGVPDEAPPERKMSPENRAYHRITTPEQLREQLQHAITLELATIPAYLYAAYSIKDPKSRASALVLGVAFEEMLHMVIACNLLNAIGGSPRMTGAFAPVYPTFIPYHATGGPFIQLQRASRDLMANTFMQIEQPGVGRPLSEMEDGAAFETIGQFYEAIADGFRHCDEHARLFIGDMARQQKAAYFGGGGGRIVTVTDLPTALRAIEEIVAQGEGTAGAYQGYGSDATEGPPPVGSFGQDRKSRELAHYFKFAALATGEVEIPETWPMETNFRTSHFGYSKEKKWARDLSDLCNACYVYMLRTMEHALNRPAADGAFFSSSFPLMRSVVTPLGRLLARTPLRRNNVVDDLQFDPEASKKIAPILVTAGPSFEYVEWSYEKIVEVCSALLEPGTCPDDEETADGYSEIYLETLARVLTALEQVERIHDDHN